MNLIPPKSLSRTTLSILICGMGSSALADNRSIDGSGNATNDAGAAQKPFLRLTGADYGDGLNTMAGSARPNPRVISNTLSAQTNSKPNTRGGSDYLWQWGQFIDHDITMVPAQSTEDGSIMITDMGDPLFPIVPLERSIYEPDDSNVRQQINMITSFIDGSMVYGSDEARATALRTLSDGLMKTGEGNLLPFNTDELHNDNGPGHVAATEMRLAGDLRANEQVGLTAMHTLFVREHNRIAAELATEHPDWNDEQLYQRARKVVGAIIQSITYNEWLPALLGPAAPDAKNFVYDSNAIPAVSNEFSTAIFRIGHSMIGSHLMRIHDDSFMDDTPQVELRNVFFTPGALTSSEDLDFHLKGLANQLHQHVDLGMIEDLRNFLFGSPGNGGLDLTALNIQRGRDHGIDDYNSMRIAFGLTPITDWSDITSDTDLQTRLASVYSSIDDCDAWPGSLAEDHLEGAAVGPLVAAGISQEFIRLAVGDAFFYLWDNDFSTAKKETFTATTLAMVIERNTSITTLQENVFFVPTTSGVVVSNFQRNTETGAQLSFMAEPGYTYQLQYNDTLQDEWFSDLLDSSIDSGDAVSMLMLSDPTPPAKSRFYRISRTAKE